MSRPRASAEGYVRADSPSLYEELVNLTRYYFGTDAPHHVSKLIRIHLHKPPEQLRSEELMSLIDWIRGMATFLEADREVVERYVADVMGLAQ